MKKTLSIILIISTLLSITFTGRVTAANEVVIFDGIKYESWGTYCSIIGYDEKRSGDLIVPSTVKFGDVELPVTSVGQKAFYNCLRITSITLPDSVTWINDEAFYGCSNLKKYQ